MQSSIIFFDGVCGLCNRFVDFVLTRDKKNRFLFSPLQGTTAHNTLPAQITDQIESIILAQGERCYFHSGAVLRILNKLGGLWPLCSMLLIIPPPIRDTVYSFIARRRYKWFGKQESCRVPTAEKQGRFLP